MATRTSSTITSLMTGTNIQVIAQFVEDTLVTTGGWLVSTETGNTLPSALTIPTAANQKKGFRVYKTNDGISPQIFVRIDYGSGPASSTYDFGMWITIGTGSDGAGNLTGVICNGGGSIQPSICSANPTLIGSNASVRCYGSADTGRVTLALFVDAATGNSTIFSLERSRNSAGVITGTGLLMVGTTGGATSFPFAFNSLSANVTGHIYLITAGGSQPTAENGLNFILTANNPSETFTPGDIGVGILIPFKGVAQQPGLNWLVCNSSDISSEGFISTVIYGSSYSYQHLGALRPGRALSGGSPGTDTNLRCLMRYD